MIQITPIYEGPYVYSKNLHTKCISYWSKNLHSLCEMVIATTLFWKNTMLLLQNDIQMFEFIDGVKKNTVYSLQFRNFE